MIHKKIFLTITFLTIIQVAFSQVKFSLGCELGANSSGIPTTHKRIIATRNDLVKETNRPIISPKIGLWTKMELGKHFYSNIGIQYLKVGNKYHHHKDGNDLLYNETYTFDEWKNHRFNKISIPLSLGYNFRIKNGKFYSGIGYRLNYYTKGELTNKVLFVEKNHPSNIDRNETLNPFDKNQYSVTANKWNSGLFLEVGTYITKKINLEIGYTINQNITYGNIYGWEGNFESYNNNDISMTLKYSLR